MTLSIELLPAPFGPMMARISPLRMSKLTSLSARTPPKARLIPSTWRRTSPMRRLGLARSMPGLARLPERGRRLGALRPRRREGLGVGDADGRAHRADPSVLELHLRLDLALAALGVERGDERAVFVRDEAAAHLARAGELAVIGVELLSQDEEALDLRAGEHRVLRQVAVDLLDAVADELVDLGLGRELAVAGIGEAAPLGPVADGAEIDVDEGGRVVAPVAEGHRLADVGEELELVLEVLGREHRAVVQPADILGPVDDAQMALLVEIAGVAVRIQPSGVF